ncbi:MAG: hypothetical protein VKJ27_03220 [Synechocystis sp.]|nr:hypothetical protein [Synechocystis sp.]
MNKPSSHSFSSARRGLSPWIAPLAIALVMIIGLEAVALATNSRPEDSAVVYNGKCPGDKDDDCKD